MRQSVAQREFDVLICYDLDRFGRNLGHQILLEQEFAKHGVSICYVLGEYKDTPEGRLNKHIKAVIAEYEREKILERTIRGRQGSIGGLLGGFSLMPSTGFDGRQPSLTAHSKNLFKPR